MAVLCDYSLLDIIPTGKGPGTFKEPFVINGRFEQTFGAGGLEGGPALLSMMVRRVTGTPRVAIRGPHTHKDGFELAQLSPPTSGERNTWRHEQFIIPTNVIGKGNSVNRLILNNEGGGSLEVRDVVFWFKQSS